MPETPTPAGEPRAVVPADIDAPDQIAWGLSFRQLSILASAAALLWAAYSRLAHLLPLPIWVLAGILVLAAAVVVALGRRDGLPLDVWLRHSLTFHARPRTHVPGRPVPRRALVRTDQKPLTPAPLRSPITNIATDGTLTVDGTARTVIACGTTSVALRTGAEQAALLQGFGRWLNSLTSPAQILISAARHDLTPYATTVLDAAESLPPGLRAAAADHAEFLLHLDEEREPVRRQVLTVVTGPHARDSSVRALTALGISAQPLDGGSLSAALAAAADPYSPPTPGRRAVPGTPVTTRRSR